MLSSKLPGRVQIQTALRSLGLITPIFRRHRQRILIGFVSLFLVNLLQLLIPRVIKQAVDGIQQAPGQDADLGRHALVIILLALLIGFCRFGWRYAILGFSRIMERDVRTSLHRHLLRMDKSFFQKHPTGSMMALATNDLTAVQMAGGMGIISLADALFMSAATLAFMAYIDPLLTLLAVSPMPVLAVVTSVLSAGIHRRFKRVQEQFARLTEFARTSLSTIRLIKAYTQEKEQTGRFEDMGRTYIRQNLRLAIIHGILWPFSGMVSNVSLLIVVFFGGRLVMKGTISIGDFVAFMSYLYMLTWPMMAIGWVTNLFQRGATSLERINAVMETMPVLRDPPSPAGLSEPLRSIRMKHLCFTYPGQEIPALADINLEFCPGVTGIIGKTGSGKSTLCHLLARLHPVARGALFFNDTDAGELSIENVRRAIAYVPQDIILFADTIRENIAIGRPDAREEEIVEAARAASLHEEIASMVNGYDTRIGERGVQLSGGQRQRIALARALLADRPVLIIDDSLSAVDAETEYRIIGSLAPYLREKTCIIVSHRLAPLAGADRIIVMDRGRIDAEGTHMELLAGNLYYRAIHEHQTEEGLA